MIPANGAAGMLGPMHTLLQHISLREQTPMHERNRADEGEVRSDTKEVC